MIIEILKWEKFNPRKDVKANSWFRLQHDFFENPDFYDFSPAEMLAWIYLLCLASKKNTGTVSINEKHLERVGRISVADFRSAVEKLETVQCVLVHVTGTLRERDESDTQTNATNERTDVTRRDETDVTRKPARDRAAPANAVAKSDTDGEKANGFVKAYCDRFKARYGTNPQITGKDAGIAKRLAKTLSQEKFDTLLEAFFAMPDAWLVKIKHPLAAFESKLNEIVVFGNSGGFTTMQQTRQADGLASTAMLLKKVREGGQ